MPRGHLSKHPTALEVAASSISISPVMQGDLHRRPLNQIPAAPARASSLSRSSHYQDDEGDDEDENEDDNNGQYPFSIGHGQRVLQPPSFMTVTPVYRATTRSTDHRSSRMERVYQTLEAEAEPSEVSQSSPFSGNPSSSTEHHGFLDERRAQAAQYFSPESQNMDAIYKRRAQVEYAVGRAKQRIAQLGLKCPSKKHHEQGCMTTIMRPFQVLKDNPFWGLWGEQLKEIEGSFGSAVVITFSFLRWVLLLNVCISILWIGAIVVPFILHPPSSFQWKGFKQYFQANGLEKTWILMGGYFYKSEQTGWYRTDYMYPCAIAVMYLISLMAILSTIARRIMGSGDAALVYTSETFPYATVVFTAWDFRITSPEAATKLRKGIRMQWREMLADSVVMDQKLEEEGSRIYYKRCAALGLLWPMVMAGTIAAIYYLVSKSEVINTKLKTGYAQATLMTLLVSFVGPFLVRRLVEFEDWKPAIAERVVIMKLFFLRALNLSTFLYRLDVMLCSGYLSTQGLVSDSCTGTAKCPRDGFFCCSSPSDGEWDTCLTQPISYCASKCMENEVGKQILKLLITSTVINSILDNGVGVIYVFVLNKEQKFSIPDFAIDIVYLQVLIWTGSHFSPLTSTTGVLCYLLMFYSKRKVGHPMGIVLEWLGSPVILVGLIILLVFVVVLLKAKLVQSYQCLEMHTKEHSIDSIHHDGIDCLEICTKEHSTDSVHHNGIEC